MPPNEAEIQFQVSNFDIAASAFPASECSTFQVSIPPQGHRFCLQRIGDDTDTITSHLLTKYIQKVPGFQYYHPMLVATCGLLVSMKKN
eukprot:scaffold38787_cov47-Attheya_sp.AAC.1